MAAQRVGTSTLPTVTGAAAVGLWAAWAGNDWYLWHLLLLTVAAAVVAAWLAGRGEAGETAPAAREPRGGRPAAPRLPLAAVASSPTSSSPGTPGSAPKLGSTGAEPVHSPPGDKMEWFAGEVSRIFEVEIDLQHSYKPPPQLRSQAAGALQELRSRVEGLLQANQDVAELHEPLDDIMLSRFLMATAFTVDRSAQLLQGYLEYRRNCGGTYTPDPEVLQAGILLLPCEDRFGRPVLVIRTRYIEPNIELEKLRTTFRAFMDAVVIRLLTRRQGISKSNPLEQYLCLVDTEGVTFKNVRIAIIKMLLQETTLYYPDRVQEIVILGVSAVVSFAWRGIAPLLHPRTRKKVKMLNKAEVQGYVQGVMAQEVLPSNWGGGGPGLVEPEQACNNAERVGAIAAEVWRDLHLEDRPVENAPDFTRYRVTVKPRPGRPARGTVYELRVHALAADGKLSKTEVSAPAIRTATQCAEFFDRLGEQETGAPTIMRTNSFVSRLRRVGWTTSELEVEAAAEAAADVQSRLNVVLAHHHFDACKAVVAFAGGEPQRREPRPGGGLLSCCTSR